MAPVMITPTAKAAKSPLKLYRMIMHPGPLVEDVAKDDESPVSGLSLVALPDGDMVGMAKDIRASILTT